MNMAGVAFKLSRFLLVIHIIGGRALSQCAADSDDRDVYTLSLYRWGSRPAVCSDELLTQYPPVATLVDGDN